MAKVTILNPMVYGKIHLNADIVSPVSGDILHKVGDVLSWDDFVLLLALGIEKIDVTPDAELAELVAQA